MHKYFIIIILISIFFQANAQPGSTTANLIESEMAVIADKLLAEVRAYMTGQNIAIAEFTDSNGEVNALGNYLAEEFTFALSNRTRTYKIIDRSQLRILMREAGYTDKGMIEGGSGQTLDKLKGVTAVVYGKYLPLGNEVKVYAKVVMLGEQTSEINVRGSLTRTPTLDALTGSTSGTEAKDPPRNNTAENSPQVFRHKNIAVTLSGCARNGIYVDCNLKVTNNNTDDQLSVRSSDTYATDNSSRYYYPEVIAIGNKSSSVQINQFIGAGRSETVLIRLSNIPSELRQLAYLQVDCNSYAAFDFKPLFKNIIIK